MVTRNAPYPAIDIFQNEVVKNEISISVQQIE